MRDCYVGKNILINLRQLLRENGINLKIFEL